MSDFAMLAISGIATGLSLMRILHIPRSGVGFSVLAGIGGINLYRVLKMNKLVNNGSCEGLFAPALVQ